MNHWASRRIEAHVKICVLALMFERIAELSCNMPWRQIGRELDALQATEFFDLNNRVLKRSELSANIKNIFNLLKITPPKRMLELQNTPKNSQKMSTHA